MALTPDALSELAQRDPAFAQALRDEALALDVKGEPEVVQRMLRELDGTDPERAPLRGLSGNCSRRSAGWNSGSPEIFESNRPAALLNQRRFITFPYEPPPNRDGWRALPKPQWFSSKCHSCNFNKGKMMNNHRVTEISRIVRSAPLVAAALLASASFLTTLTAHAADAAAAKPRARAYGISPGVLRTGPLNAITDVAGVKVGQTTLIEGDNIRTGVTAILPHGGNLFQDKVPAGYVAGNAFGKFAGSTQIDELGELETPVILTNTLSVAEGIAGTVEWTLAAKGNEAVRSVNAVVGETNDGFLNAIRLRRVTKDDVRKTIEAATAGPVAEGNVGAGTGTQAFGWKGGIGSSSRLLPKKLGGYTVGVLVQTNYGGVLSVDGAPVGKKLGQYLLKEAEDQYAADGSIVVVIATDAPLSDRNLKRLARRAFQGIGATGSPMSNGSGEYAMAFSTAPSVRRTPERRTAAGQFEELPNDKMTPLFQAAMEATEEAIYNAMVVATTMTGDQGHTFNALPIDKLQAILAAHGIQKKK